MMSYDKYILGVTLFLMLAVSSADIHCKMKSGCSTQCDPIGWNNIEKHLFNKEFSITCRNSESESLQKDIADLKLENKDLQLESIKLEVEIKDLKLSTLEMRETHEEEIEDLKSEYGKFKNKSRNKEKAFNKIQEKHNKELEELTTENRKLKDFMIKIQTKYDKEIESLKTNFENLQQKNLEMKIENKNLKNSSTKMQEKYNEDIDDLNIAIKELKQGNKKLLTLTQAKEKCPMMYGNKCFFYDKTNENKTDSQKNCVEKGGNLANIYDENHLNMIMTHARSKFYEEYTRIPFWLGMTYNSKNGKVFLSNGTKAKYVRWSRGFPDNHTDNTAIALMVDKSPTEEYQYMLSVGPSGSYIFAVCEI